MPKLEGTWGVHYEKFNRVAQAWAIVGVAAAVRRDNGSIAEARIGLTNMGSTPMRAQRRRAGARRRVRPRRPIKAAAAQRRRRHHAAVGPRRQGRLPPAPGDGAHRPRGRAPRQGCRRS